MTMEIFTEPDSVSEDLVREFRTSLTSTSTEGTGMILVEALRAVGVVPKNSDLLLYKDLYGWKHGGSETYIAAFVVKYCDRGTSCDRSVLAKAVVVPYGVDFAAKQWIKRKNRLTKFAVSTPFIYGYFSGTFFEEFIPYDFDTYFSSSTTTVKQSLAEELRHTAEKVMLAGFSGNFSTHNLRTDGSNVYVVDVGEDLGHYRDDKPADDSVLQQALHWIACQRL